jgi:hypothetical protein
LVEIVKTIVLRGEDSRDLELVKSMVGLLVEPADQVGLLAGVLSVTLSEPDLVVICDYCSLFGDNRRGGRI